jgi:hypothetical protein
MKDRARARELAAEFNRKGDPTGWFEQLYQEGEAGKSAVPWANLCPNPHLLDFWKSHAQPTAGRSALTIGSGLGDDAEQLAAWGFDTTAFDISETAIRKWNTSPPICSIRFLLGVALSILYLRPTRSRFCLPTCALGRSKTLRGSFAPEVFCSSSLEPANRTNPKARCPGL